VPGLHAAYPDAPIYIHRADTSDLKSAGPMLMPPIDGQVFWDEGDTLTLGALAIEVLHTPGHSRGSVVLRVGDVLFTGDTLFRGSMGRTDLEGGSDNEIMASLKRLAELPGDYKVYPGHEGATTLERERRNNYYMREAMGG
jgi:glyoxylase-like metal-dependent hydrolase (beta-lactamase superfamily II)